MQRASESCSVPLRHHCTFVTPRGLEQLLMLGFEWGPELLLQPFVAISAICKTEGHCLQHLAEVELS